MSPLTRRQLLATGVVGAGAAATGGVGLWWVTTDGPEYSGGADLVEPEELTSRDGLLEAELTVAAARVRIGDRDATVQAFNGSLPGPTLRVSPGDTIRVVMTNELESPTNLHVHGLHVSPRGRGDNPFRSIAPGESADYEFTLPDDHAPGTYWYHPHRHGHVADQVAAGLYGAIIVEDPAPLPVTRERTLVVSDISLDGSGALAEPGRMERMMGREGEVVLVNGQVRPTISAAPGDRERWRIVNACTARYLDLSLAGQDVRLLGRDLGRLPSPEDITATVLAPGNRVELLVEAREGSSALVATPVDRGGMGSMMGGGMMDDDAPGDGEPIDLLTLAVSGTKGEALAAVPEGPALRDLRGEKIDGRRTLDFDMAMGRGGSMMGDGDDGGMMAFTINGEAFDATRTDISAKAGSVEEWTLTNSSPMDHPVHLHVWPMQVIEEGQDRVAEPRWLDVVNVPASGSVKVLIAFDTFSGRTVYHCHILDHEDQGMMGTVAAD
ncbi:multicopper oxidase family protein [Janibacter sp. GS2]|uniref:multicopper oxidase family protein n=1 Tax=Janibacter sp. GS2 TaxID=3442646 RepID=UPI003EB6DB79